jgi:uncharacterized protein (TIGR00730 family)
MKAKAPRGPARPPYAFGDAGVDAAADAIVRSVSGGEDSEFGRQLIVTVLKMVKDGASRADLRQFSHALKEMRYANKVFAPTRGIRKATIFGSARLRTDDASYRQAVDFARRIADAGWMVITGAGGGIMQAGNEGAGPERSFGVNIRLPFEQSANPHVQGQRLVTFRYFFTRKLFFLRESSAIVLFPGGFGTLDEGMEALTLMQTGKTPLVPILLVDDPGGDYWQSVDVFFREELLTRGLISEEDIGLYRRTSSVEEAVATVLRFYSNYHSSRRLKDLFLLRLRRPPSAAQLAEIQREFVWVLPGHVGRFEVLDHPVPGEGPGAPADAPWRLVFPFDHRSYGRLRTLVDRVNDF